MTNEMYFSEQDLLDQVYKIPKESWNYSNYSWEGGERIFKHFQDEDFDENESEIIAPRVENAPYVSLQVIKNENEQGILFFKKKSVDYTIQGKHINPICIGIPSEQTELGMVTIGVEHKEFENLENFYNACLETYSDRHKEWEEDVRQRKKENVNDLVSKVKNR